MEVRALQELVEGFDYQQAGAASGITTLYFETIRWVFLSLFF